MVLLIFTTKKLLMRLLFSCFGFLFYCTLPAQSITPKRKMSYSIAAEAAVPTTEQAAKVLMIGVGASFKALKPIGKKDFITGNFGVLRFAGRPGNIAQVLSIPGISVDLNVSLPPQTLYSLKFGYRRTLNDKFYAEADAGYNYSDWMGTTTSMPYKTSEISGLAGSIGLGWKIKNKLEFSVRHEWYSTSNKNSQRDLTSFLGFRGLVTIN